MIRLTGINRLFEVGDEKVHALNDVNLEVEAGEYLSIMGPSGSGKSTLLNILGLLDRPSSGTYHLDEVDSSSLSDDERAALRRDKIGFVFQFFHLIPRLTAFENVELPLVLAGMDPAERRGKVEAALASLGLTPRAAHRPEQLSGGQRQRVAIARATIMDPPVLLADEPTGNLDSASGGEVVEILETLNNRGITLLVVTHDEALGRRATRRIHMVDGAIVEDVRQTPS
ncbi:MAG: ABC transporter ATP-binding protein [Gammaproteobacteria bacterium]|nr:ABC transporter ATP-binding protein [Gammaproteobacteria bacterium]